MLTLKVKKLNPEAKLPIKSTSEAAGFDFFAATDGRIDPGDLEKVSTGIALEIPKGYFGFTRARSGIATKNKVNLCSSNVIDSDYRGELVFPFINLGERFFQYQKGDKIGQMMILPVPEVNVEESELSETERNIGGFGSTGVQ